MSLINDALKRAKDAQQDAPASTRSGPPLRPVETEILVRHGLGLGVPIVLAVVALLILFFVWQYAPRRHAAKEASADTTATQVRARTMPEQELIQSAKPEVQRPVAAAGGTSLQVAEQSASQTMSGKTPSSEPITANAPPQPVGTSVTVAKTETNSAASTDTNGVAGSVEITTPQPPKPALPKLQGIVFDPRRPSAVINGKTLFIGERIGALRLVAIAQDNATLVGGGQTNVLTLEQ